MAERLMDDVAYTIGLRPMSPFLEEVLRRRPFTEPKNNFRLAASACAGGVPAASSGIATVTLKGTSQGGRKDSMGLGKLSGAAFVDLTDDIDLGFPDGKTSKGDSEKFQLLRGESSSKSATIKSSLKNLKRAANEVVEVEKSEERKRNDKQPDSRVLPASILEDWIWGDAAKEKKKGDAAKEKKKGEGNEKGNNFVFDVLKALKGNDVVDDDIDLENASISDIAKARAITFPRPRWKKE